MKRVKKVRKGMVNFEDLLCKKEVVSISIDITGVDQLDPRTVSVVIRLQNERFRFSQKEIKPEEKPIVVE
jgi:hypothetical protein